MNLRRNLAAGGVAASLMASLFAVSMAGPAMAATVPPVTTTVTPVGATTYVPIAAVTAIGPTDIAGGSLTLTLPAGFSWAIGGAITTVETNGVGGKLAVSGGTITVGGTTATFSVTGAALASTITFSSAPVTTATAGASGNVVLSGLSHPSSVVVARVHAPEGAATANSQAKGNDQPKGNDNAKGNVQAKGHGARKVAFYASSTTCATAQPIGHPASYGFAILNTTGRKGTNVNVVLNVVLKGAAPNATYTISLNQGSAGCALTTPTTAGTVHTNARGNGTANLHVAIVSGAKNFWVSATNVASTTGPTSPTSILGTPAATLKIKH
ncbi:MAG TPA: hypothetical protein VIK13_12655 [Candidatus Limnocylindrales bacterium]